MQQERNDKSQIHGQILNAFVNKIVTTTVMVIIIITDIFKTHRNKINNNSSIWVDGRVKEVKVR